MVGKYPLLRQPIQGKKGPLPKYQITKGPFNFFRALQLSPLQSKFRDTPQVAALFFAHHKKSERFFFVMSKIRQRDRKMGTGAYANVLL
jgi:hypothetical protein